ncbi:MAG: hypothetical protein A2V88_12950 [Elusimicrobia bacterium RBG_16_66_12]|nr:MAG: hypothetical protein A2V88_12950 [Elusimicrobia bacterium RBG_16_66_12]
MMKKLLVAALVLVLQTPATAGDLYSEPATGWDAKSGWCFTRRSGEALDIDCRGASTSVTLFWRIPEELRNEDWTSYGWNGTQLRGWPAYTFVFRTPGHRFLGLHVGTRSHILLEQVWAA